MSGAFETAAGAFAVVGVADVVIRSGRELYTFFADIADAPNELKNRTASSKVLSTFESALKALGRELQSLKTLLTRFGGVNKTWSRIKYVLDERKTRKALESLERSKTLLVNALSLAQNDLATLNHRSMEALVQQTFQQIGLKTDGLTQNFTATFDAHQQALAARLDDSQNRMLASHDAHQQTLSAKLDCHQNHIVQKHDTSQQAITSRLDNQHKQYLTSQDTQQQTLLSIQNQLTRSRVRNQRDKTRTSEGLASINRRVAKEHRITRDMVTARFDELQLSRAEGSKTFKRSGRNVHFFGNDRDMIMAYLLPLKGQLKPIIERLLTHYNKEFSPQDIMWLNSEFQHLLASAAQEGAACHLGSTATSFDEWCFSEDTFRSLNTSRKWQSGTFQNHPETEQEGNKPSLPLKPRKRLKHYARPLTFDLPFGKLQLTLPQRTADVRAFSDNYDIRLSVTSTTSDLFAAMDIRFTQDIMDATRPQLCSQLNVFTVRKKGDSNYSILADGTIEEIDTAFREGRLSPYALNDFGEVLCIYIPAENGRSDVLNYLDSQGIGIRGLRHENSLLSGFLLGNGPSAIGRDIAIKRALDDVYDKLPDPVSFVADLTMRILHWDWREHHFNISSRSISVFLRCLDKIQAEGYECAQYRSIAVKTSPEFVLDDLISLPALVRLLFDVGADIAATEEDGTNLIQAWCYSELFLVWMADSSSRRIVENVLSVLIEAGVDVNHRDNDRITPSAYARFCGCWTEWCQALQRSGKLVEEVLETEGNSWLLEDNWLGTSKDVFEERTVRIRFWDYLSHT